MKKNKNQSDDVNGYIEGYYGRLLNWEDRKLIIKSLKKNKMNTYFYAPKEDINHRLDWRKNYSVKWRKNFRDFNNFSQQFNIRVIAGIAPGIDFDFANFNNTFDTNVKSDINILVQKSQQLISDGATAIALLLDDISNDFQKNFGNKVSEGKSHATLANVLSKKLNANIFFVPRVYADELIEESPNYLIDLHASLNKNIKIFYCGENVVCKTLPNFPKINNKFLNQIVYWDNYYANDYCPRRLFVGPYSGRKSFKNIMINATGLIKTDLLILDIITSTINKKNPNKAWLETLNAHKVPLVFNQIKKFFLKPDFSSVPPLNNYSFNSKYFEALELLLWSWKSQLSREWYPYLFGLKHDLQLNQRTLTSERLIKTQNLPLAQYIKKGEL